MGIPKIIKIKDGTDGRKNYYFWDSYDTYEEAKYYGKKIKFERRNEREKIKYFILESQDSWFLPVTRFALYFSVKLRIW